MSERERMYQLLDAVPDNKVAYIIGFIQGLTIEESNTPNAETMEAMEEAERMIATGNGQRFEGSAKDFVNRLLGE